jgi:hypothetical protein
LKQGGDKYVDEVWWYIFLFISVGKADVQKRILNRGTSPGKGSPPSMDLEEKAKRGIGSLIIRDLERY